MSSRSAHTPGRVRSVVFGLDRRLHAALGRSLDVASPRSRTRLSGSSPAGSSSSSGGSPEAESAEVAVEARSAGRPRCPWPLRSPAPLPLRPPGAMSLIEPPSSPIGAVPACSGAVPGSSGAVPASSGVVPGSSLPARSLGGAAQLGSSLGCWSAGHDDGHITMKMNALVDSEIIDALYRASQAGVPVEIVVRGICALRAGVPGLSENIRVRSILGRFLEHSRVYYFENGGNEEYFCSSADWMDRNFFRRTEVCFPIRRRALRNRLRADLELMLADNCQSWQLSGDGNYRKAEPETAKPVAAQERLLAELQGAGER